MKKLQDICIFCIASNLHALQRVGQLLPTKYKELVLERLVTHDMLTPEHLPHVTYNLFSSSLRNVTLFFCEQVDDAFVKQLGSCGAQFHTLKIIGCKAVTDSGLATVLTGQNQLEFLQLKRLTKLTSTGLKYINCQNLIKLDLSYCANINSKGVAGVLNKNSTIKVLNLRMCTGLHEEVFPAIANSLKHNLEELDVQGIFNVNDSGIMALAENCPNLNKLNCHGAKGLSGTSMVKLFECCHRLRDLDLSYCTSESVTCLAQGAVKLQELSLCGVMLNDEEVLVKALCQLTSLTHVRLCGVPAFNDSSMQKILQAIGENLELLDLNGSIMSSITDEGMKYVTKYCTNLKFLGVSLLAHVTGTTLIPLFERPPKENSLQELHIGLKKLNELVLHAIVTNCVNLTCLRLSGLTMVDDSTCTSIAATCTQMRRISIKGATEVTDSGILELVRSCPLEEIVLAGVYRMTDKSIFAIANSCPYLEEIYLNGCVHVTKVAIRYLQDCCIPRVYVQHRVPNVDPGLLMAKNLDTGEFQRADQMVYTY